MYVSSHSETLDFERSIVLVHKSKKPFGISNNFGTHTFAAFTSEVISALARSKSAKIE